MKRLISLIVSACIVLSITAGMSQNVCAADGEVSYDVNPFYESLVKDPKDLFKSKPPYRLYASSKESTELFTDFKSAAMFLRDCMLNRVNTVTIMISKTAKDNLVNVYRHDKTSAYYPVYGAFSFEIARYDNDGDYLASCFNGASCTKWTYDSYYKYRYTIRYRTTYEEEKAVAAFVNDFVKSVKAQNLSRLEQVKAVHDKICEITDYDEESYNNGYDVSTPINTAYAAVATGLTMCEGYSALFYRMCRALSIPVRTVDSDTHAWNLVKPVVGKYYYNIDVTWDDGYIYEDVNSPYGCRYFLKNDADMISAPAHRHYLAQDNDDHNRLDYYSSDYFKSTYPVSDKSFYLENGGAAVCSYCGDTVDGAEPADLSHIYAQTTVLPTCTKDGKTIYACTHCSECFEEAIPTSGEHLFGKYDLYCAYGCKTVNPNYVAQPVKISKLTAKKKAVQVKWKKVTTVKGYQIKYSTSKKFKNAKTVTVSKNTTVSKRIKKLKSKKRYYFKIRTYNVVNGKKVYSKWSAKKSIKTK